jgi:hypothetical protein
VNLSFHVKISVAVRLNVGKERIILKMLLNEIKFQNIDWTDSGSHIVGGAMSVGVVQYMRN